MPCAGDCGRARQNAGAARRKLALKRTCFDQQSECASGQTRGREELGLNSAPISVPRRHVTDAWYTGRRPQPEGGHLFEKYRARGIAESQTTPLGVSAHL